jgi:MFS family permease
VSPTFRSLHVRNYRIFATGAIVSNTGTWMQRVAQDWLVLQLTGSATAVGISTGLQFLPLLLFGMYGGVLADRFDKRRLLMLSQAALGVQALILGLLAVTGTAQAWHVYVLAFVLGCITAVDNPTRQSFLIEMVGKDDLPNAVALNSASFNMARLVGPAIAGVLLVWIGAGWVVLVNAFSFSAVIWSLSRLRRRELRTPPAIERAKGQLREGLQYVRSRPDLLLTMVLVFFVGTFGLNFSMLLAVFAAKVFDGGAAAYGWLSTAMAVGTLGGALVAARRGRPLKRLVLGSAFVFGVLEVLCALMPTYWLFLAMLVPTGFAALTFMTSANATLQLGSAPEMRGRVMALYTTVFFGGAPLGAPLMGWLAEVFGPRWSLVLGGSVSLTAAAVVGMLLARKRDLVIRPHVLPRPHVHVRPRPHPAPLRRVGESASAT